MVDFYFIVRVLTLNISVNKIRNNVVVLAMGFSVIGLGSISDRSFHF